MIKKIISPKSLTSNFLCLLLSLYHFCSYGESTIQISGEVNVNAFGEKRVFPFEVKLGSSWQIKTTVMYDNPVEYISGLKETDCYHIKRVIKGDTIKEFAWISEAQYPRQHYGSGQFLWLAFCSSNFFSQLPRLNDLSTNEFPLLDYFTHNKNFYNDDILVTIKKEKTKIIFLGPSYILDANGKKQTIKDGRFLAAEFEVTSTTNFSGLILPLEFRLIRYLPPGFKISKTDSAIAEEFTGNVASIKKINDPVTFVPEISTLDMKVIDSRFSKVTQEDELNYTLENRQWLQKHDSKLIEMVNLQKARAVAYHENPGNKSKRRAVLIVMISISAAFFVFAFSVFNKSKKCDV
jgi:hypothetical protein